MNLILAELFQYASSDFITSTKVMVNAMIREKFPIHYVYGFSYGKFSYFLTVQPRQVSPSASDYVSKLG